MHTTLTSDSSRSCTSNECPCGALAGAYMEGVEMGKVGLPSAAHAYLTAIANAGWRRRLAALYTYVEINGHTRGW